MKKYQLQSKDQNLIEPEVLSRELEKITSQGDVLASLLITVNHTYYGYSVISYGAKHQEVLVSWLKSHTFPVKKLSLHGNCINDTNIIEIIDAICGNTKLEIEELDINHNDFGTTALEYIVQKLKDKQIKFKVIGFAGYDNGRYGNDKLLTSAATALIQEIGRYNPALKAEGSWDSTPAFAAMSSTGAPSTVAAEADTYNAEEKMEDAPGLRF